VSSRESGSSPLANLRSFFAENPAEKRSTQPLRAVRKTKRRKSWPGNPGQKLRLITQAVNGILINFSINLYRP